MDPKNVQACVTKRFADDLGVTLNYTVGADELMMKIMLPAGNLN